MSWVAPRTWTLGETVTASLMNAHIRDNLLETCPATVTTAGDITYADAANSMGSRLGIGAANTILTSNGSAPTWGAAWTPWTPTYTNITVGNGTVVARYVEIGKTVHAWFQITLGSTSSVGNDATVSTPVTASSDYATARHSVGQLIFWDDSANSRYSGDVFLTSTTVFGIYYPGSSASIILTANTPQSFAINDVLAIDATYEAA